MNPNHPKAGSTIKVEPIKSLKDISTIKKLLADHPRNYALFVIGINTNLRAGDLLKITVGQVKYLGPGESFEIKEQKTGKARRVTLNKTCIRAIYDLLMARSLDDQAPLFLSQKGGPLTVHRALTGLSRDGARRST